VAQDLLTEESVDSPEQQSAPLSPPSAPSTPQPPPVTPRPQSTTSRPTSAVAQSQQTIRRRRNPPELQHAENQMSQAFNMLQNAVSNKRATNEVDECDLFGQVIAKKLRKLSADERDLMMYDIQGMFIRRRHLRNIPHETVSSPISSHASSSGSPLPYVSGHHGAQYCDLQPPQAVSPVDNEGGDNLGHSSATGIHHQPAMPNTSFTSADIIASALAMTFQGNK
jgi:hypothetical protein